MSNIQLIKLQFKELNLPSNSPISDDIITSSYLKICSVIDELGILNHYCKDDPHLTNVLYCLKPLVDHVKQYENGFRQMRNGLVAHLNRDRLDHFKPFWHRTAGLDVPQSNEELEFVWNCLDKIRVILISAFPAFKSYHAYTHNIFDKHLEKKKQEKFIWSTISEEDIKNVVNSRLITKGFIQPGENYWQMLGVAENFS